MIGEPMTLDDYKRLASDIMMGTYGDCFSEAGWGINFAFDIATALYVYNADRAEAPEIEDALKTARFHPGLGFSVSDFLEVDTNDDYDEYTSAKMIYDELVLNDMATKDYPRDKQHGKAKEYAKALVWFCEESDRQKEAKKK